MVDESKLEPFNPKLVYWPTDKGPSHLSMAFGLSLRYGDRSSRCHSLLTVNSVFRARLHIKAPVYCNTYVEVYVKFEFVYSSEYEV